MESKKRKRSNWENDNSNGEKDDVSTHEEFNRKSRKIDSRGLIRADFIALDFAKNLVHNPRRCIDLIEANPNLTTIHSRRAICQTAKKIADYILDLDYAMRKWAREDSGHLLRAKVVLDMCTDRTAKGRKTLIEKYGAWNKDNPEKDDVVEVFTLRDAQSEIDRSLKDYINHRARKHPIQLPTIAYGENKERVRIIKKGAVDIDASSWLSDDVLKNATPDPLHDALVNGSLAKVNAQLVFHHWETVVRFLDAVHEGGYEIQITLDDFVGVSLDEYRAESKRLAQSPPQWNQYSPSDECWF